MKKIILAAMAAMVLGTAPAMGGGLINTGDTYNVEGGDALAAQGQAQDQQQQQGQLQLQGQTQEASAHNDGVRSSATVEGDEVPLQAMRGIVPSMPSSGIPKADGERASRRMDEVLAMFEYQPDGFRRETSLECRSYLTFETAELKKHKQAGSMRIVREVVTGARPVACLTVRSKNGRVGDDVLQAHARKVMRPYGSGLYGVIVHRTASASGEVHGHGIGLSPTTVGPIGSATSAAAAGIVGSSAKYLNNDAVDIVLMLFPYQQ